MTDELEVIASRFHAGLAALHFVAAWFNFRKKNYVDCGIHAAFTLYDLASAIRHAQDGTDKRYATLTDL